MDCESRSGVNISISLRDSVEEGYTMEKIKELCGEPTKIKNWNEEILTKYNNDNLDQFTKLTVHYSMWTYNKGSNTFIEYLLFKDGMLVDLKDGDYGSD